MSGRRPLRPAPPARLFFGVFTPHARLFDAVRERIEARFGPCASEEESPPFPFPSTRTYARSMGPGPFTRKFFFLRERWPQDGLAPVKRSAIEIEEEVQCLEPFEFARAVNIDPGLLNDCRIILASTKDYAHRLYRADGVWEEVTLVFQDGAYRPLPWTYPDFRNPDVARHFAAIRERHLETLMREAAASAAIAAPLTPPPASAPPPGPRPPPPRSP